MVKKGKEYTYDTTDTTGTLPVGVFLSVLEFGVVVGSTVRVSSSSGPIPVDVESVGSSCTAGSRSSRAGSLVPVGSLVKGSSSVDTLSSGSVRVSVGLWVRTLLT
jgi:hypothetical protein